MNAPTAMIESQIRSLPKIAAGKVRDIYRVDDRHLLMVQTDRVSAFDVVLRQPIPGKGETLTAMSKMWFDKLPIKNHATAIDPVDVVAAAEKSQVENRALVVRRLSPLPIEAVCRGYLVGSGWKDYQQTGAVCGIELPPGLRLAARFDSPLYTPATKAEQGAHDENISQSRVAQIIGAEAAAKVRAAALRLYELGAQFAAERGVILADTKFEFALEDGEPTLIDEALTPDSSRFWPADEYREGENPPSFDKQFVRDWLETQTWDKTPPPPDLPPQIVAATAEKYREIRARLRF